MSFDFSVNFEGLETAATHVTTGFYHGKVKEMEAETAKSGTRIRFQIELQDEGVRGAVRSTRISIPRSADDKVLYFWRDAFLSCGYAANALESGEHSINPATFVGQDCFVKYVAGDPDLGQYDKLQFLSERKWNYLSTKETAADSTDSADSSSSNNNVRVEKGSPNREQILRNLSGSSSSTPF
tara:strand:+ start:1185 stop:1733 length:549 start_codon:yes stop_codon:yes gene_type:complete